MNVGLIILVGLWIAIYAAARKLFSCQPDSLVRQLLVELIAASGWLALLTIGFFWQITLTDQHWMPAGGGDLAPFLYPNYRFAAEHLKQGIIPLWNPHLYSGTPFAADIQTGLFYPINLIVFVLVPSLAYEWLEYLAIFHFWLAGLTMYLCLRLLDFGSKEGLSCHPLAAFAGALAFEFSDLFIVHFGNLNMIAVAAWLPLIFLLYHHALKSSQPRYGFAAASGAVLAIATLAGHIQITLFILLALAGYTLFRLVAWLLLERPQPVRTVYQAVMPFLLMLLITIGLSALLFLPAYQMSRHTPRAELPYAEAARYSLHPVQLIGLFIPNYFGRDPAHHWGPYDRVETGYIGILTLFLALLGLILSRSPLKWYWLLLGSLAMLLALGGYSILHGWLYALVPGFGQLRAPARFILLVDFSLAALAALGLNRLICPLEPIDRATLKTIVKNLTWIFGGLLIMALPLAYYATLVTQDRDPSIFNRATAAATGVTTLAIFVSLSLILLHSHSQFERFYKNHIPHHTQYAIRNTPHALRLTFPLLAILIIALDLFTLGSNVDVGQTDPTTAFNHPEAMAYLHEDPNLFRIEVTTDVWHLWQPDTALLNRLYDVWGLYNPLTLADTTLYWSGAPPRHSGRYNFLGVKYIIASKAGAPADGDIVPVFDGDPNINIYLNRGTTNRVLFVQQATVVADHAAAWEAIRTAEFDPTQTVILERGDGVDASVNQPEGEENATATLALFGYDLHTVTVSVQTDAAGYLVLADAYYPGWQATIDGQPTPIVRANYAFRAVAVPIGDHIVQMVFNPPIWWLGLTVTGLTAFGLVGWAALGCSKMMTARWRHSR